MNLEKHTDENPAALRILMAGCGKMGGAMLASWVRAETGTFTAVDPGSPKMPEAARHVTSLDALDEERFDGLIVAVKPQLLDDVLPPYEAYLRDEGFALSIAAGVAAKRVSDRLGGAPVIRVMPNLPAAIGRGVSALYAGEGVTDAHRAAATKLIEATGTAVWLEDEDQIDRFTAVAGSGPGYVFEILRSYVEAAKSLGFDESTAREMVFGTVLGTTEMAQREGRPLDELRNDVTSPNGTTQAGLDQLRRDGVLDGLMEDTLRAAYDRAVELR